MIFLDTVSSLESELPKIPSNQPLTSSVSSFLGIESFIDLIFLGAVSSEESELPKIPSNQPLASSVSSFLGNESFSGFIFLDTVSSKESEFPNIPLSKPLDSGSLFILFPFLSLPSSLVLFLLPLTSSFENCPSWQGLSLVENWLSVPGLSSVVKWPSVPGLSVVLSTAGFNAFLASLRIVGISKFLTIGFMVSSIFIGSSFTLEGTPSKWSLTSGLLFKYLVLSSVPIDPTTTPPMNSFQDNLDILSNFPGKFILRVNPSPENSK